MLANNLNLLKRNGFLGNRRLSGAHVGFHYGEEIDKYIELECETVICFEPIFSCYKKAIQNLKMISKLKPHSTYFDLRNCGCGEIAATKEMHIFDGFSSGLSSIKEPLIDALSSRFGGDPRHNLSNYKRLNVSIDTLDRQLNTFLGHLDFLVIDTQGYELEVLKGATKTLSRTSLIEIEITRLSGDQSLYKEADNYEEILQILLSCSFIPITPLSVTHASVLFAKKG